MTKILLAMRLRLDALAEDSESGQGTVEYVGMVVVAVVLVLAVLQAVEVVDLGGFFSDQIQRVKDAAS